MNNLHKLYYRDYYNGVKFEWKNIKGKEVLQAKDSPKDVVSASKVQGGFEVSDFLETYPVEGYRNFELEIMYPGLVTGVGIDHQANVKGEFKLGMHFDYTTGLPIVYGSSVKGVLKSYFSACYEGDKDVDALIAVIFDGLSYNLNADARTPKPIYDRDVFFDAIIVEPSPSRKLLESDALAPHGGDRHDNPFAAPVPIPFIKIAPGTRLRFRFKLVDTKDEKGDSLMTVDEKIKCFKKILTTYGIGAKTNVGYGQLKEYKAENSK